MTTTNTNTNTNASANTDSSIVETIFKTEKGYNECDHCQSVLSPAAYFVKLMETVEKYIIQTDYKKSLRSRRPDLYSQLKLDCDNTNKEELYLEIVNNIMLTNLKSDFGSNTLQKLATAKYPFNLPTNLPLVSIRSYLKEHNTSLVEIYKALIPNIDITLEDLEFSPEAYKEIISTDTTDSHFKEVYGIDRSSELNKLEEFVAQTGVEHNKLQLLFDSYNKVKELSDSAGLSIDHTNKTIINLNNQALGFLHRFIRLANKLNWSFDELSNVLIAIDKEEINSDSIKQIAKIENLHKRFKQPVTKIAKLYSQEDILSKKVENLEEFKSLLNSRDISLQEFAKDANSQSVLQSILGVNSTELTSLIEYNDSKGSYSQTGKSLFRVYKQVLLARLIGVPIAQFMEFLSLLNTNELNAGNIERIIELNDWLRDHSITAEQIKKLINFSTLEKELIDKINKEVGRDIESFSNIINKYVKIQPDLLYATHEFTKKFNGSQHITEKLFHNITVFSELKLSAEDIDNITKHSEKLFHNITVFSELKLSAEDIDNITKHSEVYSLNGIWSLEQIKTLVNYKTLKNMFFNGDLTLPQYVDWLQGKDYNKDKIIEKIVQLTKWNRDVLENISKIDTFKPYFTKDENPISSLLKIKTIMDIVMRSGINSAILLELRHLYTLEVNNDTWKKYTDAEYNLKLSSRSEAKDRAIKHLAEQKRDVLARYMVYKLKMKNMRDLYSHLLIDVEMSDCSKISPLKAALNSVQLYIHRCMMRLEKGVKIEKGLNEEKWKWLSSYREWEANNKIKLYPENYLDPTLRSITTPEYKTLQSTLMQGNITDEAVSDAYMKYFEDFEQVASLKIVDSCFERVVDKVTGTEKNTLFIIGRILAKPYMYYYRTAVFDTKNRKILYWTAWERIEVSIPVETVTPIYAFDRLFLFWVQTNEKKEMNVDSNGKIKPDLPLSNIPEVTINYIFQRPSGSWSAQQELASNVRVNPAKEVNKLHWKKVAAFYLKEKGGDERRIVITIGKIEDQAKSSANTTGLFTLDEDLVTCENKPGYFFDASYNTNKLDNTDALDLSCDIDKSRDNLLLLKFTKNTFKSNITNKEDNAEPLASAPEIKLLSNFKVSTAQQVINKPGWFIVEGNLERENVRESFLLLPKGYDLSAISNQSTYESVSDRFKFQYFSDIPRVGLYDIEFTFIRLNITGNIRKLRQKAYAGGPKRILTLDSQKMKQLEFKRFQPKDKVIDHPPDYLDFNGAYGIYLWEIFFHVPTLIALYLNQEREFGRARMWYQYILNPTNDNNQTWQFLPFTEHNTGSAANVSENTQTKQELEIDPFDPYVIAKQKATAFEKYIIIRYIDNLIDWGDMLFAKKSWEAINQATMLYIRAWDLLGRKPIKQRKLVVEAQTFEKLVSNQQSGNLSTLCRLETELPATGAQSPSPEQSCTRAQSADEVYDMTKYGYYFCKPENKDFIDLWNRVEDCLYKIRHCLDSQGKRLVLPLFQAPIDPRQLIQTYASGSSTMPIPHVNLPHYRFSYMINYAKSVVETVMQFGSELLGVLEKRDAEALNILYNKQEGIISNLMTSIKERAIEALKEERNSMDKSLLSAKGRKSHYEKLINDDLLNLEKEAIDLSSTSLNRRDEASIARLVSAVSHLMPTVLGFACGAFKPGDAVEVGAASIESRANIMDGKAGIINTNASYKRRAEDWELQKIMASYDTEQITHQMEANKINQANAEQDLKVHKEAMKHTKEKEEFFRGKFSNQELYNWMKGQIASIYFQAYKMALEVAKQAEKTYQYELNNDKEFITNSSWNSLKEGLLAGNSLKFILEQMAKSYNEENKRTLEIIKVVSLGQLNPMALHDLRTKGSCEFSLTERLFDWDFPGHYCRKIKSIKITIPAVVGPYENIHASLQQTSNKVVMKPDINAVKFLLGEQDAVEPENNVLRKNLQLNQEIAISKGDQDNGLFELNFNDERYLPFEGTGAISDWKLSLPEATNRFDTSTISDAIIQIDYTAFNDGGLGERVKRLPKLEHYHGTLVINLSKAYPNSWKKFKQTQTQLTFNPSPGMFPSYAKNPELDGSDIYVVPKTSNEASSTISLTMDGYSWDHITYKLSANSGSLKKLAIGGDWNLGISSSQIANVEEVTIVISYKAKINWQG